MDDLMKFIGLGIAGVVLAVAFWIVPSCAEAQAYNRITGSNVTTFEAMFVELRVSGEPATQPK